MAGDFEKYILSTGTHWISNSGSDENGRYTGGTGGDQTGKEWQLKAWYNRPWTVVLRYPDQAVAEKIAELSVAAALNDKIGYDQSQRTAYWQALKAADYDPAKISTPCEGDCTAGVSANVKASGALMGVKKLEELPICSSRNMRDEFTRAGFIALTASKYLTSPEYLLPGDILLYESHHAAANVALGAKARAEWKPGTEEPRVRITGDSVFVRKGPGVDYSALGVVHAGDALRYFGFDYPANGWRLVEHHGQTGWVSGRYGTVEARQIGGKA